MPEAANARYTGLLVMNKKKIGFAEAGITGKEDRKRERVMDAADVMVEKCEGGVEMVEDEDYSAIAEKWMYMTTVQL